MGGSVYTVNKGVNKPVEFKGLKAQYLVYLAVALVGLLVFFAVLFIAGVNPYGCVLLVLGLGGWVCHRAYGLSRRYGQYGMMKKRASRKVPEVLVSKSRKVFRVERLSDH